MSEKDNGGDVVRIVIVHSLSNGTLSVEGIPNNRALYLGLLEMAKMAVVKQMMGGSAEPPRILRATGPMP